MNAMHWVTALQYWEWLAAHWPALPGGCRFEYGRAPHGALHWLSVCHARPGLRRWPVLVWPHH